MTIKKPAIAVPFAFGLQFGFLSLLNLLLASVLEPADFGATRLISAYIAFATIIGVFCVHDAVSPLVAGNLKKAGEILGSAMIISTIASAVTVLVCIALVNESNWVESVLEAFYWNLALIPITAYAMINSSYMQGAGHYKALTLFAIVSGVVPLMIILVASNINGLNGWAIGRVLAGLGVYVFAIILIKQFPISLPTLKTLLDVWRIARVQIISGVLSAVMISADYYLLGHFDIPLSEVAVYGLIMLFAKSVTFIPNSIGKVYIKRIAESEFETKISRSVSYLKISIAASFVTCMVIYVCYLIIVKMEWLEPVYLHSSIQLLTALIGSMLYAAWSSLSIVNVALKRNADSVAISIIGVIVAILMLNYFIPIYGINGAIVGMNVAYFAGVVTGVALLIRYTRKYQSM